MFSEPPKILSPANEMLPRNRRVLTIDDNPNIHADYRKVLLDRQVNQDLASTEAALFGETEVQYAPEIVYQIDSASQGKDGFDLVKQAIENNDPYHVAFIDVRMPPGWDGIETAKRIWEIAPDLPLVLCTAYSDHSWEEISIQLCH
jgi:CheY-like chemotaxis protein